MGRCPWCGSPFGCGNKVNGRRYEVEEAIRKAKQNRPEIRKLRAGGTP